MSKFRLLMIVISLFLLSVSPLSAQQIQVNPVIGDIDLVAFAQDAIRSESEPDYEVWSDLMFSANGKATSTLLLQMYREAVQLLISNGQDSEWDSLANGDPYNNGVYSTQLTLGRHTYQYSVKCHESVSVKFEVVSYTTTENLLAECLLFQTQRWLAEEDEHLAYKHVWNEFGHHGYAAS